MEAANASHTPAPESTVTVAPFRAWRSSQLIVARGPTKATIDERRMIADKGGRHQSRAVVFINKQGIIRSVIMDSLEPKASNK